MIELKNRVRVRHKNFHEWGIGEVVGYLGDHYYLTKFKDNLRRFSSSVLELIDDKSDDKFKVGDLMMHKIHGGIAMCVEILGEWHGTPPSQRIRVFWLSVQEGKEVHYGNLFVRLKDAQV